MSVVFCSLWLYVFSCRYRLVLRYLYVPLLVFTSCGKLLVHNTPAGSAVPASWIWLSARRLIGKGAANNPIKLRIRLIILVVDPTPPEFTNFVDIENTS